MLRRSELCVRLADLAVELYNLAESHASGGPKMEQKLGAQLDKWLSRLPFKACNVPGNVSNASGNASNATGNETNVTGHVCGSFDTNFVRAPYQHCNASEVDTRFVPDYGHRAGHALCWPAHIVMKHP